MIVGILVGVVMVVVIDKIFVGGESAFVDAMVGIDVELLARLSWQVGCLGIAPKRVKIKWLV